MNLKLFQINYLAAQTASTPDGCIAWDNTANPQPELREFPVFERIAASAAAADADYWGAVSPKFQEKSAISPRDFQNWILANPGAEVYFVNPVPIMESLWPSTVYHGEHWHPGLAALTQRTLHNMGYRVDLNTMYMDRSSFALCNYFVGSQTFWRGYIEFVNEFLAVASQHAADHTMLYVTSAAYNRDRSAPYYSFVVERLFSVFLMLENWPARGYQYSRSELQAKTQLKPEMVNEIVALSDIKRAAVSGGQHYLMEHWSLFRNRTVQANQHLFLLE